MSAVEEFQLGRDWLAVADFNTSEMRVILGDDTTAEVSRASFNWIATYLIEEVGIYEREIKEWFRSPMRRLDGRTPLEAWRTEAGFDQVYGEAQRWSEQVAEDLEDEPEITKEVQRKQASEAIADAVTIFRNALLVAGAELTPEEAATGGTTIWNRAENPIVVRWQGGNPALEGYKISIPDGARSRMLTVVLLNEPPGQQQVIQSGLHEWSRQHPEDNRIASDWDDWPLRADLEPFVSTVIRSLNAGELELVK